MPPPRRESDAHQPPPCRCGQRGPFALAGCSNPPETVNSDVDRTPAAAARRAAAVGQTASKTYRCADNSLFFVEFYSDNTAVIHRGSRTRRGSA